MTDKKYFPPSWLKGGVNPEDKNKQAIKNDRWDREDLKNIIKSLAAFQAGRKKLGDFTPTGEKAMNDMFWALLKADPELENDEDMAASYLINRRIQEEARQLDEYQHLRRYSVGDDVQAALSAYTMEPELETLFDRQAQQQKAAQELQNTLAALNAALQEQRDLDEMIAEWTAAENLTSDNEETELTSEQKEELDKFAAAQQAAADAVEQAQKEAEAAGEQFNESMDAGRADMRQQLKTALGKAAEDARDMRETAMAWGTDPSELQRLPADKRLALAKKLNDPRFKRIANLFGPMHNLMLSEQKRKTVMTPEEVYDVEQGNDIGRLLPQEILLLAEESTEMEFMRRYYENELMQYALRGVERLSRGGIILCEDGSGSMHGDRELWAKAVMLCLLHLARQQKREFHLLHFGSPGQIKHIPFTEPAHFSMDRIIEAAEIFWGGGTDFYTPMKKSRDILLEEFKRTGNVHSDVVFVTDDECWITDSWLEEYLSDMHKIDATTWGILVGGSRRDGPLLRMTEGKVAIVKDLASGDNIRDMFRGVT